MASFTDQVPQFTPYVSQLPVEAMVQVGMEKQKRYEEGVQKIQTYIDNVAGLDIMKDVDKNYLQSKLNQLGGNLTALAGADFSNFQLVNSVSGMAGQIINDKNVQNAVKSTQRVRKEQENIQLAQKNGKSSPENEAWFNDQLSEYLNDPEVGMSFSGEFIEYRDVDAKLRDLAGKLKEVDNSIDIPFQRDEDGNVLYFKRDSSGKVVASTDPNSGGEKRVDDAMLRVKVKGISAQRILDNFYSSLDENDKRQLMITGNYHYRGATAETFKNDIITTYNNKKEFLAKNIADLSVRLKTDNTLTSEQRRAMEAAIAAGNTRLSDGSIDKEMEKELAQIDAATDIKDYKYRVYTQKYLTGLAKGLANESRIEEIMSNPYAQMAMEKKKLAFDVERARVADAHWWADHQLDVARYNIELEKWTTEKEEKERLQPIVERGGLSTNVPMPTIGDVDRGITELKGSISALDMKYGNTLFPELSDKVMVDNPDKPGQKISQRQLALNQLVDKYVADPSSITNNTQRKYVEQVRVMQDELTKKNNLYTATLQAGKQFDDAIDKEIRGQKGIYVGNREVFSSKDLYEATRAYNNAFNTTTNTIDQSFINKLPNAKQREIAKILVKRFYGGTSNLSKGELATTNAAFEVDRNMRQRLPNIVAAKYRAQGNFLATRMPEVQSTYGTLNVEDKVTKAGIEYVVGNATELYNQVGALDVQSKKDFDPAVINEWRSKYGDEKLTYIAEKKYDGSGYLKVYSPDNQKQIIPMSAAQLQRYFPKVAKSSFMTPIKYQTLTSTGHTTNSMGSQNPAGAFLSGYSNLLPGLNGSKFAGRVRVDIEGDPDNDGSENDRFQVVMYAHDGRTWKAPTVLNNQGFVDAAGVEDILANIGETTVREVLNQK